MTEWRSTTLGEILTVKHGYAFKGEYFAAHGSEIVLTPGNFPVGGGLQFREGKERYYTGPYPAEFKLAPGQLLVVMTDLKQEAPILGSPALVPQEPPVLHNQRLGLVRIRDRTEIDYRFLYYLLLSDASRSQLRATATGSTVRHTAPERIYRVRVDLPPLATQMTIGKILGTLDDLIENNRRRIELLEQMAQAIYREWFVHFRYPGHENVPLVDSPLGPIPEGWAAGVVDQLCARIQAGGTPRRSDSSFWDDGQVDWYKTGDLTDSILISASERISEHALISSSARIFDADTILMAIYGSPTVGRLGLVKARSSANQAALGLVARPGRCTVEYLWFALRHLREHLNKLAQGAAQQNVSKKKVQDAPVLVPPLEVSHDFSRFAGSPWRLSHALALETETLAGVRDLVLPKLVTGQIDVSELDLEALVVSG